MLESVGTSVMVAIQILEKRLVELQKSNTKMILQQIQKIERKLDSTVNTASVLTTREVLHLPVTNIDEVKELDEKLLNDNDFKKTFIEYIARQGGHTMKSKVNLIMNSVYNQRIPLYYNWSGSRKKASLEDTEAAKLIIATLFEKNSNCTLREDVLNHIKSWMRNKCDVQKRLSNKFSISNVNVSDDVDRKYFVLPEDVMNENESN